MTAAWDAAEAARLVQYVHDRTEDGNAGPSLRALADQLEAALAEIASWSGRARASVHACKLVSDDRADALLDVERLTAERNEALTERDAARAEVGRLTKEHDALRAIMTAPRVCPGCGGRCERLHMDMTMHVCTLCGGTGERP